MAFISITNFYSNSPSGIGIECGMDYCGNAGMSKTSYTHAESLGQTTPVGHNTKNIL